MTIKSSSSGSLSFTEIKAEFGNPTDNKFGSYRVSQNIGSLKKLPLDTGIPKSGSISFGQFYGKELNIVVKCTGGNLATAKWSDGVVVGGFKSRPSKNASAWQGGKRVFINITGTYSSNGAKSSDWAFKTGNSWPTGTEMSVVVGSEGQVVGRGGNGGSRSGKNGKDGSNALRVWSGYEPPVSNGGYISGGGGGGGGGGDAEQNDWGDRNDAEGGGGGGGNGLPAGSGGSGNGSGSSGNLTDGGDGQGGEDDNEAEGGDGGRGGSRNKESPYNAGNGENASEGNNKEEENGSGGEGGKGVESY